MTLLYIKDILTLLHDILGFAIYSGNTMDITIGTLIFIVVSLVAAYWIVRLLKKAILKVVPEGDKDKFTSILNFVNYFIYIIILLFVLNTVGVNINMFLTASAALFVGLGFALQKIFQDLIAGIYIMIDRTLNTGDIIEIEDKVARVKVINLRSTIAETRDKRIIVIPNHKFIDNIIHNWTQDGNLIRASIEVGVYIGSDIEKVKDVLLESASNHPEILIDPAPLVQLKQFGESSIRFGLFYFIENSFDNDRISSDVRFEVDKQFKKNGIKLPVPVIRIDQQ